MKEQTLTAAFFLFLFFAAVITTWLGISKWDWGKKKRSDYPIEKKHKKFFNV